MSIGLETEDGNFSIIIPKGTNLPTKKSNIYKITESENDFIIKIYQGEDKLAKNNKLLFKVKIDEDFKFTSVLIITIEIDKNGLINLNILDKYSKYQKNILYEFKNIKFDNEISIVNNKAELRKNQFLLKEKICKIINNLEKNELINKNFINDFKNKYKNIDTLSDIKLLEFKKEIDSKFNILENYKDTNIKLINDKTNLEKYKSELSQLIEKKRQGDKNFNIIKKCLITLNTDKIYNIKDKIDLLKNI